jgi:hypothetical protein
MCMKIRIKTLIDITRTDVRRKGQGDELKLNQQHNFQTLQQVIALRNLINLNDDPYLETRNVNGEFGTNYKGEHKVWTYEFEVDHADAYYDDKNDPVGLLKQDLELVPITGSLTETVPKPKMFIVNNKGNSNITVEVV